jgi:Flp pilus assembly protein TadG
MRRLRPARASDQGRGPAGASGQALVEFSLAFLVFVTMLMGLVDLARGVYAFNGVSQAAREIARATSVHPGTTLGDSSQTAAVLATQRGLVPGLGTPTFACVDIDGSSVAGDCVPGDSVKVTISATYQPITPVVSFLGTVTLQSSSSIEIP